MKEKLTKKTFSDSNCRNEVANRDKEVAQWEKVIHCFYDRPFFPCSFITDSERKMEYHYKKVHYLKEVSYGN